jgi:MOSC domain-containing protein YiiM
MLKAKILSINISKKKGTVKTPVESATLIENFGLEGDAHAGKWHRQVSMLSKSSIDKMEKLGLNLKYGDFAENITVDGVEVYKLPVGTKVRINEAFLEITQIGKECHSGCAIAQQVGKCVMPQEGIFLKVLKGGRISVGDEVVFEIGDH